MTTTRPGRALRPVESTARTTMRRAVLTLAGLWLLAPLLPLLGWAVADVWRYPDLLPTAWGWQGWTGAVSQGAVAAAGRSVLLGLVVATLATALGAMAGRALACYRLPTLVAASLLAPVALPPFAVVMGLNVAALRLGVPGPVAMAVVLTVAAIPYTTFVMRAAYAGYDPRYEEEARSLGATAGQALWRVRLPLIAPGLAMAAFLAFLVGWSDYIVTLLLGGGRLVTLPILVGALASGSGNDAVVAAASVAALGPPLVLLAATTLLARRAVR